MTQERDNALLVAIKGNAEILGEYLVATCGDGSIGDIKISPKMPDAAKPDLKEAAKLITAGARLPEGHHTSLIEYAMLSRDKAFFTTVVNDVDDLTVILDVKVMVEEDRYLGEKRVALMYAMYFNSVDLANKILEKLPKASKLSHLVLAANVVKTPEMQDWLAQALQIRIAKIQGDDKFVQLNAYFKMFQPSAPSQLVQVVSDALSRYFRFGLFDHPFSPSPGTSPDWKGAYTSSLISLTI